MELPLFDGRHNRFGTPMSPGAVGGEISKGWRWARNVSEEGRAKVPVHFTVQDRLYLLE